jgi:N-acetylmuramic acid 6-phosphate etherase
VSTAVGVDLGKTGCRAGTGAGPVVEGPGAPGLADPSGVERAVAAVRAVLGRALDGSPDVVVVGAAGAEAAPGQRAELARRLAVMLPAATVAVTTDSVTAHAGALAGAPGTVLAVGTGSVALGVGGDGRRRQVDGWGPWLGDDGSGMWIGRAALRAVLRDRDGRGAGTTLTDLAEARFGDLALLPRTLHAHGAVARTTAAFVPDVVAAADRGDRVAAGILDEAARLWVELTAAAADAVGEPAVAVVGGLAGVPALARRFEEGLPAGLVLRPPAGTPLDGALLLADRQDLPHEAAVTRIRTAGASPVAPVDDVDVLATEQVRADLRDLDTRTADELVAALLQAEATVPTAMVQAAPALGAAVRLTGDALARGGRLLYVGAGTPGRLAALDAAECPPTFGTDPDQVVALLAGGRDADRRAVEGAEDDAAAGDRDLLALEPSRDDVVVGISASGRTPYVLAALDAARRRGAATVAVVNNAGSALAAAADVAVELVTGPEVLSGSTRLKAGTAQKIALNVLSTGAMIACGKTYGAWMVDVVASNEKLRRRARRILREATGVDDARAAEVLQESGWRTKTALVALLAGTSVDEADGLLDRAAGRVRDALAEAGAREASR